jgi:predicted peroxiredoxin
MATADGAPQCAIGSQVGENEVPNQVKIVGVSSFVRLAESAP